MGNKCLPSSRQAKKKKQNIKIDTNAEECNALGQRVEQAKSQDRNNNDQEKTNIQITVIVNNNDLKKGQFKNKGDVSYKKQFSSEKNKIKNNNEGIRSDQAISQDKNNDNQQENKFQINIIENEQNYNIFIKFCTNKDDANKNQSQNINGEGFYERNCSPQTYDINRDNNQIINKDDKDIKREKDIFKTDFLDKQTDLNLDKIIQTKSGVKNFNLDTIRLDKNNKDLQITNNLTEKSDFNDKFIKRGFKNIKRLEINDKNYPSQNNRKKQITNNLTEKSDFNDKSIKKGFKNIKRQEINDKNYPSQNNRKNNEGQNIISQGNQDEQIFNNTNLNDSKNIAMRNQNDQLYPSQNNRVNKEGQNIISQGNQDEQIFSNKNLNDYKNIEMGNQNNQLQNETPIDIYIKKTQKKLEIKMKNIGDKHAKMKYKIKQYLTSSRRGQGGIFLAESNEQEVLLKIYNIIEEKQFDEEVDLINSIKEPINILGNRETIKLEDINMYIVVQEKCEFSLGDELELFKQNKKEFTELNLLLMIFDLLDGLIEIRSHNIIHSNIKPANILKTHSGKYVYTDFDCASKLKGSKPEVKGYTLKYCAPEQLEGDINYNSDVYSLGKTLQIVIQVYENNQKQMNKPNLKDNNLINQLNNLIEQKMLVKNWQDREEIMILLKEIFQIVSNEEFSAFHLEYMKKLSKIIELYPFDNGKDIKYFSKIHLQYSRFHLNSLKITQNNAYYMKEYITSVYGFVDSLTNIGKCYQSLGQYDLALQYNLESLEMKNIFFSGSNLSIADSLSNIGACYKSLGQYDSALKFYLESLEMNKKVFSHNHSRIADCLNNIGACYESLGQYDLALKFILQYLEIKKSQSSNIIQI